MQRLIIAALETGCRLGELLTLRWRDVDELRKEFRIRAEHAKDGEDRILPISTRLSAVLEMARLDPEGYELEGDAFVFGDGTGARIQGIKRWWKAAVTSAKVSGLRFHDLRHEAGSRFVEGGMPLHHVKELLGHANIKTTDTYLNVTRIGRQDSMRKFDEFRKTCTPVAQTDGGEDVVEGESDPVTRPEAEGLPLFRSGGVDGTRTRGLRRDRPAF